MLSLLHTSERRDRAVLVAAHEPWSLADPPPSSLASQSPCRGGWLMNKGTTLPWQSGPSPIRCLEGLAASIGYVLMLLEIRRYSSY